MKLDWTLIKLLLIASVLSFAISYIIVTELKLVFHIPRPCVGLPGCDSDFSFPGRHAGVAFAVAAAFSLYMKRKVYWAVSLIGAGLVAYWRVAIGDHTVVDVVGGAAIGIVIGLASYYLVERFVKRHLN